MRLRTWSVTHGAGARGGHAWLSQCLLCLLFRPSAIQFPTRPGAAGLHLCRSVADRHNRRGSSGEPIMAWRQGGRRFGPGRIWILSSKSTDVWHVRMVIYTIMTSILIHFIFISLHIFISILNTSYGLETACGVSAVLCRNSTAISN